MEHSQMIGANLVAFSPPDDEVDYPSWYSGCIVERVGPDLWVMEPVGFRTDEGRWLKYDGVPQVLVKQTDAGLRCIDTWPRRRQQCEGMN
jgi:hypothetical protein